MYADTHKPNWLFRGLIVLSVGVHLIVLVRLAALHHPRVVSRIELTLQSTVSRPQRRIVAPPKYTQQIPEFTDHQRPPLQQNRNWTITAPQYRKPEPAKSRHLKQLRSLPQLPDQKDPVAAVWEEPTAPVQIDRPAPSPAPQSKDRMVELSYADRVRSQIEAAKEYPQRARRRSVEGVVRVLFTIGGNGALVAVSVLEGSDNRDSKILERAAVKAVQKAAPFDPPPKGSITIELPVKFRLKQ